MKSIILGAIFLIACAATLLLAVGKFPHSWTGTDDPVNQVLNENLAVYFFDVGQGDCSLVDYGETEILVDVGPGNCNSEQLIEPYIQGKIEGVVITHNHADHDGNLDIISNDYTIDRLYRNDGIQVGDNLTFDNLTLTVLNAKWTDQENENSLVLELAVNGTKVLFMGDGTTETEALMMSEGLVHDVDILKVGHHGSKYSSSNDFLSFAKPEIAIISVGDNSYGHPTSEALSRLISCGAEIYRTDKEGTIVVTVMGEGYNVWIGTGS